MEELTLDLSVLCSVVGWKSEDLDCYPLVTLGDTNVRFLRAGMQILVDSQPTRKPIGQPHSLTGRRPRLHSFIVIAVQRHYRMLDIIVFAAASGEISGLGIQSAKQNRPLILNSGRKDFFPLFPLFPRFEGKYFVRGVK